MRVELVHQESGTAKDEVVLFPASVPGLHSRLGELHLSGKGTFDMNLESAYNLTTTPRPTCRRRVMLTDMW